MAKAQSQTNKSQWEEIGTGEIASAVRWTKKPNSEWEKKNSVYLGDEIVGEYVEKRTRIGKNDSTAYILKLTQGDRAGEKVTVWETALLADRFDKVPLNSKVRIINEGIVEPKTDKGRKYRSFKFYALKSHLSDRLKEEGDESTSAPDINEAL